MIRLLEKKRGISFILTILITIEIFYFSTLAGGVGAGGSPWPARIYHTSIFFLFTFFLFITIKGNKKITIKNFLIVLIISITYSILDEIHQIFVPGRDASMKDLLANSLGIFSAIILYNHISKKSGNNL